MFPFNKLKSDQYDFVIAPETFFSEGYGENVEYFEYTKLHDSLSNLLDEFKKTNLISGIQFFKLYQNEEDKPSKTANFVRDNLWVDYYNSSINFYIHFFLENCRSHSQPYLYDQLQK